MKDQKCIMDPNYRGDGYGYQNRPQTYLNTGSDESNHSDPADATSNHDILHNFPYLRHGGFRQDVCRTPPHTHQPTTLPSLQSLQQTFMQNPNITNPMSIPNTMGFLDSSTSQSGKLPSMATFNTALSQMHNQKSSLMFDPQLTTSQQSLHPQASLYSSLPGQQTLPPVSSIVQGKFSGQSVGVPGNIPLSMQSMFPTGNLGALMPQNNLQPTSLPSNSSYYHEHLQHSNATSSLYGDVGNHHQNLQRHAVLNSQQNTNREIKSKGDGENRPISFMLLGTLAHQKQKSLKSYKEKMLEPIDSEDFMHDYSMHYFSSVEIKTEFEDQAQDTDKWQDMHPIETGVTGTIMRQNQFPEPSLADIRAGAMRSSGISMESFNETTEKDINAMDDSITNDCLGNSSMHGAWYSSALKGGEDLDDGDGPVSPAAKRGGRSDPDNPFAITSPSFSESAAKAVMTTTNSSVATFVTISIMSIGSRKKLIPNILSSSAAQGGIVSVVNPVDEPETSTEGQTDGYGDGDTELKLEKTSIMSKLKREKQEKKEHEDDDNDTEIDRLDISIKIDDDQLLCHGEHKRWQCRLCPKSYTTKHNLVAHIMDHSGIKPHLCLVCGKYFKQLSHLNTHMLTHDNVKPHKCKICHKGFTQISHLKRHETMHLGSKPYICDICNRGFAYPSELRLHKEKHVPGKEKCTECDEEFSNPKELHDHMLSDNHCKSLTCKHCEKVFKFPSQLKVHMMCHAGARPFICTECGMDFMKEHHLKAHQFTHTGLRPYTCPHCNRAFNQKANMVRHMLIHNAERAFKCEVCSKTFTQPQTLKAHMVVHSDKKPYSCRFCGKQFGRQHNLQGHLHMHGDSKPYVCSICQSSFTLKGNLNRHKKVKHGLNESTESMEEDAVNFLSSLSHRVGESNHSEDYDDDTTRDDESYDGLSSLDNRSPKKNRKSTPRKRVASKLFGDGDVEGDGGAGSDVESEGDLDETQNMITYSDEERENERMQELKSKYFKESDSGYTTRPSCRRVGIKPSKDESEEEEEDGENEEKEDEKCKGNNNVTEKISRLLRSVVKTEVKDENENGVLTDAAEHTDNLMLLGKTVSEKRSMRKRKKKELDKGFTDEDFCSEGEEDLQPSKSQRRKGTKLDTIIASKFKSEIS